jgi:RNA polymerase sigma factor (sigma-70 family)
MSPPERTVQPDETLVRAIADGDTAALELLYGRYGHRLSIFLTNLLQDPSAAEDTLQEVMVAVWRQAATFRGSGSVLAWLLSIARHLAINKRRRKQLSTTPIEALDEVSSDADIERDSTNQEQYLEIMRALERLPSAQRETLELVFFYELTEVEVAQVQGIAVGTVKSRLHRAKYTLRQLLSLHQRRQESGT